MKTTSKKKKTNRLPYHAETRNLHFGIRRGNVDKGEHPSETLPGKRQTIPGHPAN